jgi:hypothetical protein
MPQHFNKSVSDIKKIFMLFLALTIVVFSNAQSLTLMEEGIENNLNQSLDFDNAKSENVGITFNEQFDELKDKPIDLNKTNGEDFLDLFHLSSSQVQSFIRYRNTLGYFIDFHELQSIPGWDVSVLRTIRPYVYVSATKNISVFLQSNFKAQKSLLLFRYVNSFANNDSINNHSLAFRYNYDSKKNISFGIVGENDPGETFGFKKNKIGFDFTSGYVFYKGKGLLKSFIFGDYLISLGQGLIHWQSAGFNKGVSVDCIKRQGLVLKPYHSFGEFNFHRGVTFQLVKNNFSLTTFVSSKKLDAYTNFDSALNQPVTISSFDYSGLHNSTSSIERKFNCHEFLVGSSLEYQKQGLMLGFNFVHYNYSIPIKPKSALTYATFSFNGQKLSNLSFHYAKTINNFHFFGELASGFYHFAVINGTIISISEKSELSFLHRMISRSFHSFYSNAFTAQTKPTNENGFYSAINMKLSKQMQLNGFIDFYKFPWLTYSVNSPSGGIETGITFTYLPNKKTKINLFYGYKKDMNFQSESVVTIENSGWMKKSLKVDAEFFVSKTVSLKTRISILQVKKGDNTNEKGCFSFIDLHYKPNMKPFSSTFRLYSFDTDGYNSRIYAYENDIMYTYSMNSFYGRGKGFYLNINYKLNKKLRLEAKWSMMLNEEKQTFTQFNWQKSQLKLQILAFF